MYNDFYSGFNDLSEELESIIKNVENIDEVLEIGAKEFVSDLKKMPKPMSEIRKSGYTHLINTFSYKKSRNKEIEIGWGKYYGPMVEGGTQKMGARPHLKPCWNQNKEKYYDKMLKEIWK